MDKSRYLLTIILTIIGMSVYGSLVRIDNSPWLILVLVFMSIYQVISKIEIWRHEKEQIEFIESIDTITFKTIEAKEQYDSLVKKYFPPIIPLESSDEEK